MVAKMGLKHVTWRRVVPAVHHRLAIFNDPDGYEKWLTKNCRFGWVHSDPCQGELRGAVLLEREEDAILFMLKWG